MATTEQLLQRRYWSLATFTPAPASLTVQARHAHPTWHFVHRQAVVPIPQAHEHSGWKDGSVSSSSSSTSPPSRSSPFPPSAVGVPASWSVVRTSLVPLLVSTNQQNQHTSLLSYPNMILPYRAQGRCSQPTTGMDSRDSRRSPQAHAVRLSVCRRTAAPPFPRNSH